ncbi:MAG: 2-isopropylmalate synthase [Dehalococcoidia bacterium]|nr:2-isopropylmalate synthase [Dehalococcoidia bacterium]
MDKVIIFDTTMRDGEQSPGATMNADDKLEIGAQLERLGVDVIEAGFPANSQYEIDAVARVAQEVRSPIICALARAVPGDIDAAWEALKQAARARIHVFLSTSDIHMMHMLHKNKEEIMNMAVNGVKRAKSHCDDVEFSPMDATRTDPQYLYELLEATIQAGATTVNIPDTVGYATPEEFEKLIRSVFENVPSIHKAVVSVHCHNDLGLAVANSLAAVRAGARQVEGCINGLGERAGNASLEEVIMVLKTRADYFGVDTNIDTRQLIRTSRLVSDITGLVVQPNKSIVGANAFRHESGIHQDGILKERTTYEIMDPKDVGLTGTTVYLGKTSGRAGFRSKIKELGYELGDDEFTKVYNSFKDLANKKKVVTDRDLEALVADEMRVVDEAYKLEQIQVVCGEPGVPTASVRLRTPDDTIISAAAIGDGPVDAVYKAISQLLSIPNVLEEFSVKSITESTEALGEVTIRIRSGDQTYTGRGTSTDIIVASAKAYINAINRLVSVKKREAVSQ